MKFTLPLFVLSAASVAVADSVSGAAHGSHGLEKRAASLFNTISSAQNRINTAVDKLSLLIMSPDDATGTLTLNTIRSLSSDMTKLSKTYSKPVAKGKLTPANLAAIQSKAKLFSIKLDAVLMALIENCYQAKYSCDFIEKEQKKVLDRLAVATRLYWGVMTNWDSAGKSLYDRQMALVQIGFDKSMPLLAPNLVKSR